MFRKKHSMNQPDFRSRVGVAQSGESRYESGHNVPAPVRILLAIAYGTDGQAVKAAAVLRARTSLLEADAGA